MISLVNLLEVIEWVLTFALEKLVRRELRIFVENYIICMVRYVHTGKNESAVMPLGRLVIEIPDWLI